MRDDMRVGEGSGESALSVAVPLPIGRHCIMEFHQCAAETLNDAIAIEAILYSAIEAGRLTLVHKFVHPFSPHGLTVAAVLQESHLVIHTWPELAFVAADLFTCGTKGAPDLVCATFIHALRPHLHSLRCFEREALVPQQGPGRGGVHGPSK